VQEAFADALRLHRGRGVRNWGGLLRHLATCRALDLLRKRRGAPAPATFMADAPAPQASRPDAAAVATEAATLLRDALANLPRREAEVFSLRYFGDLSNAHIAEALGISAGAVAVALHKARARLRAVFEPERDDDER
jgi:RNA polymerase sigma-70 factor (ECF subfamily)